MGWILNSYTHSLPFCVVLRISTQQDSCYSTLVAWNSFQFCVAMCRTKRERIKNDPTVFKTA